MAQRLCAESVTDVRKILLSLLVAALVLCTVACVPTPPAGGGDGTEQTDAKTEQSTNDVTENASESVTDAGSEQGSDPMTDQGSDETTEPAIETTEEETTYGELHFPESGE